MRITRARLTTRDLDATARWYGDVLGLPAVADAGEVTVSVGSSEVTFVSGPTGPGCHHVAFDVPEERLADAHRWLEQRVPLLVRDGSDRFDGPGTWNSSSVYFTGPDGTILELIARHDVQAQPAQGFRAADVVSVSEVGIAVPDAAAAARALTAALDESAFGPGSDDFRPVGDVHGLLIVVSSPRVWFPTADTRAGGGPLAVSVVSGSGVAHTVAVDGRGILTVDEP